MRDSDRVQVYNTKFNNLAAITGWDNAALRWAYQRGLSARIKDKMVYSTIPVTLAGYRALVIEIDNRYWRREDKKCCDSRTSSITALRENKMRKTTSNQRSGSSFSSVNSNPASSSAHTSANKRSSNLFKKKPQGSSNWNQGSGMSTQSRTPPAYAKNLRDDGKLTPAEHPPRTNLKLCMFCGEKHKLKDCNLKNACNAAKGRSPQLQEPVFSATSAVSGN